MIKRFISSELGKGAIILFLMMNLANLLNFIFHFAMGRMLGPKDYGTLAVLMSLIYIYGIPVEAIQNLISRYATKLNSNREYGKLKFLLFKSLRRGGMFGFVIFLILIPISFFIGKFLSINPFLIIIANLFIFSAFSSTIGRGILQGRKRFKLFGSSLIVESVFKILFSVLFVFFGMQIFGAIIGAVIGFVLGILVSVYFNFDLFMVKTKEVKFNEIYLESVPYFITTIVIILIFSLDIILAKRFFSEELAGQYAVLSMIGKMVYFGTISIGKAMFPLTSEKAENGQDSKKLFLKSFFVVGAICLCAVFAFLVLPEFIVWILYGSAYVEMASYLVYSGISFSFLALSNLVLIYALSINKLKRSYFLFFFLLVEIVLLSLFHDSILEYILAFMFSSIVMFVGSLFFIRKLKF